MPTDDQRASLSAAERGELRRVYRAAWPRCDGWRRVRISRLSERRKDIFRRSGVRMAGAVVLDLRLSASGRLTVLPLRDEHIALRDRCEIN